MNKTIAWVVGIIIILIIVALGVASYLSWQNQNAPAANVTGTLGTSTDDLIHVTVPLANVLVQSPLTVSGEARGNWYFEGSFPVKILDANGEVLGQVPAQAQGEWTTGDFVPFKATLQFTSPTTETGTVVFQRDNPSGLPANDASVSVPVYFSANASKL